MAAHRQRGRDSNAARLLRLKPAAEYLSFSPAKLRAIIQRGELPFIRIAEGRNAPWLVDKHDLDLWIEQSKSRFQ
jgi:excisionase family DNA binding protein